MPPNPTRSSASVERTAAFGTTRGAPGAARLVPLEIIEPRRGFRGLGLAEVWRSRELLYFLVWRDLKVRYKQTILGAGWALLQPLLTMILFTLIFGRLGGLARSVSVPYPVFAYAGILPWTFFSFAVTQSAQSLLSSGHLISKVYFPRLIIPLAAAGGGLADLAISSLLMLGLVTGYGIGLGARALLLPLFLGATVLAAAGVGALLAALTAIYRDFRHVTGFLIQSWMLASPVAYPLEAIPERFRLLYALNPMVAPIAGCRAALLGGAFPWDVIAISSLSIVVLCILGAAYFRSIERRLADVL